MKTPVEQWLKDNSWNLMITFMTVISAFAIANYRINAVEKQLAQYPSQDWFELRFTNIDDKFNILTQDIKDLQKKVEIHLEQ